MPLVLSVPSATGLLTVTAADFAAVLGVEGSGLPTSALSCLTAADFGYTPLLGAEREACILTVLEALETEGLPVSGPGSVARWERGWRENLERYLQGGHSVEALVPKYFKHMALRYRGVYIRPNSVRFEQDFYTVARHVLFQRYLTDAPAVVEFGCGTGTSLLILSELFPGRPLIGCDWARSSQELLAAIAGRTGKDIRGAHCDMFEPPAGLPFPERAAVITMAAMEQLGTRFGAFLGYLLAKRPSVCLHLEPIVELYDPRSLFDHLAIRYHQKRGYLTGFLTALRELEAAGRVRILEVRRLGFGSFYHEGYSVVAWRVCD